VAFRGGSRTVRTCPETAVESGRRGLATRSLRYRGLHVIPYRAMHGVPEELVRHLARLGTSRPSCSPVASRGPARRARVHPALAHRAAGQAPRPDDLLAIQGRPGTAGRCAGSTSRPPRPRRPSPGWPRSSGTGSSPSTARSRASTASSRPRPGPGRAQGLPHQPRRLPRRHPSPQSSLSAATTSSGT
jgi:hypothetical protein